MGDLVKHDSRRQAHVALDELLRQVDLSKLTGPAYLRLDCNQGGVTATKIGRWTEDLFKPST